MDEDELLVVAVCGGARCSALRRLHDPTAGEAGPPGRLLREAVRGRPGAVLISTTACLGPCHRGCVAAVGHGRRHSEGSIAWSERPVGLGMVELSERAVALASWVGDGAPLLCELPAALWQAGAA